MSDRETQKEIVNRFLGNFKNHLSTRDLTFVMREKNEKTLTEMGFTLFDVRSELLKLDYKDYISGPEPDVDPRWKGDIWEFGKNINYEEIYIKIKLAPNNRPICLSFHYPERYLEYFFK